ncbi:MAG: hypothetical protein Harvfovirus45_12 [Harvfovirus sp.]|uniref:Sel1 repeat family protein n=1 Tax=Harvfovirus sp. TaxID=2487768 RepID=A0A3G5A338_9VIRU|nr:MAG: hypothetical protein Harvfovirus45_12 [Harvfovirus sp.]
MGVGAVTYMRQEVLDVTALERDLAHDKVGFKMAFKICDHHIGKHSCAKAAYLKGLLHSGYYCGHINWEKARKLFEFAAEKNDTDSIRELSVMYFLGKRAWAKSRIAVDITDNEQLGLLQTRIKNILNTCPSPTEGLDYKRSFQLLNDGIRLHPEDGLMQLYFGQHYEFGCGTDIDYKMALDRYEESFRMGQKTALDYICGMYIGEKGCDLKSEDALRWFTLAQSTNRTFSKIYVAKLYEARGDFPLAHKLCYEHISETRDNQYLKMLNELTAKKDPPHNAVAV